MISTVEEGRSVKAILEEVRQDLDGKGIAFKKEIPFGLMIEVPAAVQLAPILIRECDFFSIGTNDLIQYTLAVDRNNERVAQFFEPLHPAILASIGRVAEAGFAAGKPVAVCGEMAGDPKMTPILVGLGVTQLSMIPPNIPLVKSVIRDLDYTALHQMAEKAVQAATVDEVKHLVEPYNR